MKISTTNRPMSFRYTRTSQVSASGRSREASRRSSIPPPSGGHRHSGRSLRGALAPALGILALLVSTTGPARAQRGLRENVQAYLRQQPGIRCDQLYNQMQPVTNVMQGDGVSLAEKPYPESWFWPTWCLISVTPDCERDAAVEGSLARAAVKSLSGRRVQQSKWICSLLGGLRFLQADRPQDARDLLDPAIKEADVERVGADDPLLRGLRSCRAAVEFRLKKENLDLATNRPKIVLEPIDASLLKVPGFTEERGIEDISVAFTWILLETMQRVLASFPQALHLRPMEVEEALVLQLSGPGTHVVDRVGVTQPTPSRYIDLAAPVTVTGMVNRDRTNLWVRLWSQEKDPEWKETSQYPIEAAREDRAEPQPFRDVMPLAQDCALYILTHAWRLGNPDGLPPWDVPTTETPTSPRSAWRVLPPGQPNFKLFVEAVGFEACGCFAMAAKRYQEIIQANPHATPPELAFVRRQAAFCQELFEFDTADRFFRANEGMLREEILKLVK